MQANQLSLEQAPPLAVPLRFFLTAPLFAVAAAVVMLAAGPDVLGSRWNPVVLAVTHLLTLGFLSVAIFGALLQLLPVLAGATVPRARRVSAVTHGMLALGTAALVFGLIFGYAPGLKLAIVILSLVFVGFAALVAQRLHEAPARHASVSAMKLSIVSLAITALLGPLLAAGHAWTALPLLRDLTGLHMAWALIGWMGTLIIGVAYQVVPMFQMTPEYPPRVTRFLVPVLFVGLLGFTAAAVAARYHGPQWVLLRSLSGLVLGAGLIAFALTTLWLQQRRRRRLPDVTLWYWRLGMLSLLAAVLLWLASEFLSPGWLPDVSLSLGVLYLVGFAVSVVSGMLYKIVPFLVWLHSQRVLHERGEWRGRVPSMKEILPERLARRQFLLHAMGLVLLLGATLGSAPLYYAAAVALGLSWAVLFINLLHALDVYRRFATARPVPA